MMGFFIATLLFIAYAVGCFSGWLARAYLDKRSRYYFRRGQSVKAASSALSIDPEPLIDISGIIDPVTRGGVRRIIEDMSDPDDIEERIPETNGLPPL